MARKSSANSTTRQVTRRGRGSRVASSFFFCRRLAFESCAQPTVSAWPSTVPALAAAAAVIAASSSSTTSTTITVMLSRPPLSSAWRTSSLAGLLRVGQTAQRRLDTRFVDLVEQPVAAQHEAVAGVRDDGASVDADVGADAERPREDVALRVRPRLFRRDRSFANPVFDEAVVFGELLELAVAEEVDARVTDVNPRDEIVVVDRSDGDERRSHAAQLRVVGGPFEDRLVGLAGGGDERVARRVGEARLERLERDPTGDLTAAVAAHAVGHREHVVVGEAGVLVAGPHPTDVGGRAPTEVRRHLPDLEHGVADLEPIALLHHHRTRHLARFR